MKNHLLPVAAAHHSLFEAIKEGRKTVETRAGSVAYSSIKAGDQLTFRCQDQKHVCVVREVRHFASLDELLTAIPYDQIMPDVSSATEAKQVFLSFPGYKERLSQYGILAFYL